MILFHCAHNVIFLLGKREYFFLIASWIGVYANSLLRVKTPATEYCTLFYYTRNLLLAEWYSWLINCLEFWEGCVLFSFFERAWSWMDLKVRSITTENRMLILFWNGFCELRPLRIEGFMLQAIHLKLIIIC